MLLNEHIYDFDMDAALQLLSDQRRAQVLRYKHELGRRLSVAAYLLLCEGLRNKYGIEEKPLFTYGEHGKPALLGHPGIHFNLSHCKEAVICVLDDKPVGVDIEMVRPYKESLARYTMNEEEWQQIQRAASRELEFTRLWTQKEAVLKLQGDGIRGDMKMVLSLHPVPIQTVVSENKKYVYSVC